METTTTNFKVTEEELASVRVPDVKEGAVHKDECCYCFDTPESGVPGDAADGGVLVCLHDFLCFCPEHAKLHWEKTHHTLYLHNRRLRILKEPSTASTAPQPAPTVLGIGVPGGFPTEDSKYRVEEHYALVQEPLGDRLPLRVEVPSNEASAPKAESGVESYSLPPAVAAAVAGVVGARSSESREELAEWRATDGAGPLPVSKFAEKLEQAPCSAQQQRGEGGKWHCEHEGCPVTDNLWLNLGDGSVLCGRGNFVGLGNNHALEHYKSSPIGDRSLVVKLGTITPTEAEVYSYSEDDMVQDPLLTAHLAHFGIDRAGLTKTGRTLDELTLDVNSRYEFSRLAEADRGAVQAYGPGCTGIANLGNSCYLASVAQALFANPLFLTSFAAPAAAERIFREGPADPSSDLRCQLAKLGLALASGKYAVPAPLAAGEKEEEEKEKEESKAVVGESVGDDKKEHSNKRPQAGIRPRSFKTLMGRIDPTFASKAQQDASEFLIAVLSALERAQRAAKGSPELCDQYTANIEERLECGETHKVRYTWRAERILPLRIPLDSAINKAEVAGYEAAAAVASKMGGSNSSVTPVVPIVPFDAVLHCAFGEPEIIDGFRSPATGNLTHALKSIRFATFPPHLIIALTRHVLDSSFQPQKINASVPVPDTIDLDAYRGLGGLQPGEEFLAGGNSAATKAPKKDVVPNEAIVTALIDMSFSPVLAKFAALSTGNSNVDAALNWVFEHMDDGPVTEADLDALVARLGGTTTTTAAAAAASKQVKFGAGEISMIVSMGFTEKQAALALKNTDGNVERAADWLLSRIDDLDRLLLADEQQQQQQQQQQVAEDKKDEEKDLAPPPAKFPKNTDSSKYELYAIIPHIGKTTNSGHYVAYVKKNDKWIYFNDSKVAYVDEPPRDMGFIYFFKRV